jgi:hypothetical protein
MSIFEMPGRRAVTMADLPEITGDVVNDAIAQAGWIARGGPDLRYSLDEHRTRLRYHWRIADHAVSPHRHVAAGAALRWKRAAKHMERAHVAELDRIEREREAE